ncbi:hypothetical protein DNU06_06660 [Putridiphycobacter roseus]|uniref:Alkyl hydroperoxide reductase subunit C/ Thiol specific antioxidant domain-containing protein n=1 Tax=Putridiphycobacter roseus TaxID=2219161 RepID=A0A2W1N137_9FLAO|nr:TlpA disulfide reductase family protein [Putridiphycobacter roseus]PZE17504.1 hypothetical protein DNU06_06660 [Putridiphycobacter roseus]
MKKYQSNYPIKAFLFLTLLWMQFSSYSQVVVIEDYADFESEYLVGRSSDTIYVFNFWATWCKPCVQELPYFDSLNQYAGAKPISLVLVSLDFKTQIEKSLVPFLTKNNIKNEVVLLADGKVNKWIDEVDPSWSGSIPATLVINGDKRLFFEQSFHSYNELINTILKIEK